MSMTFDIPDEIQAAVAGIANLDQRVASFLRHEAEMEAMRRRRHSPEVRALVDEAVRLGEADKAAGFDWDESFEQFRKLHAEITSRL